MNLYDLAACRHPAHRAVYIFSFGHGLLPPFGQLSHGTTPMTNGAAPETAASATPPCLIGIQRNFGKTLPAGGAP